MKRREREYECDWMEMYGVERDAVLFNRYSVPLAAMDTRSSSAVSQIAHLEKDTALRTTWFDNWGRAEVRRELSQ